MSAQAKPDLLTPYIRNNIPFQVTLAALVLLPGAITYFGPSILTAFGDAHWMGIGWGVAIVLTFISDENFVPGKNNLMSGVRRTDHLSHRLVTNPMFILGLVLLILAPPPVTFYGPVVFGSSPDWLWLILGWVVAAAGTWLGYSAMRAEEGKLGA